MYYADSAVTQILLWLMSVVYSCVVTWIWHARFTTQINSVQLQLQLQLFNNKL